LEILPRVVQKCIRHNLDFNVDKFTKAYNIKTYKNGYYPYCNTCIKDMLAQYIKNTGCLVGGFYYLCARLDIPFIKKVWDSIQDNPNHPVTPATVLDLYTKALNNKSLKRPFEIWDDFSCSDALNDVEEAKKSKEQSEQELKDFIFNWGKQESEEDYEFLIYTFNRYAKNVEFVNPQQEDLYRDLCLARLEKRKAEQANAPETDITKIQTRILNIMNKLHLDDFETTIGYGPKVFSSLSKGLSSLTDYKLSVDAFHSWNTISKNIKNTGFENQSRVINTNALDFICTTPMKFDIAFIDPPYKQGLAEKTLSSVGRIMNDGGKVICEHEKEFVPKDEYENLHIKKTYKYGKISVTVFIAGNEEE
jgi:16S rRNA G966 N2-methylase RsmD